MTHLPTTTAPPPPVLPTLHLDQITWASVRVRDGRLRGRLISALVHPQPFVGETCDLTCPEIHPGPKDLLAVNRGDIDGAEYFRRVGRLFTERAGRGLFAPGTLEGISFTGWHERHARVRSSPLRDGDLLVCACARPGSPNRRHPCHLEELAPHLVRAGWRVLLYERELVLEGDQVLEQGRPLVPPSRLGRAA